MTEELFETCQPKVPQALVRAEPAVSLFKWTRVQSAVVDPSAHSSLDQPGILERLDVFRHRCERRVKRLGQLGHGMFAPCEAVKDGTPSRVAQRMKDEIEVVGLINHMVEYASAAEYCQPIG